MLSSKSRKYGLRLSILLCFVLIFSCVTCYMLHVTKEAQASFNQQINYQAKLMDGAGALVADGSYDVTFKLYTVSTGGTAIWTETWNTGTEQIVITNGLFSVMLGKHVTFASQNVDFNQTLYLGVTVESDSEMTPRKIIGAVPAAFYSGDSDKLDGRDEDEFALLAGRATPQILIGATGVDGTLTLQGTSATGNTATNAGLIFKVGDSGGTTAMTILNNGDVGIGDSTPDNLLEILSSSAANTQLTVSNTNAGDYDSQIGFELADGTNTFTIGVDDSDSDKFKISTTALGTNDRLVIDSSGNVGINNSSPDSSLDIKATSGQTADLVNLANSSGNNLQVTDIRGALTQYIQTGTMAYKGSVTDGTYLDQPYDVDLQGKYAFVVAYNKDRLTAVDISDPSNPSLCDGANKCSLNDSRFDAPVQVKVRGKYAYVLGRIADTLSIVDISNPESMSITGSVQDHTYINDVRVMEVVGNYAYITSMTSQYFTIVDISDPANPQIIARPNLGLGNIEGMVVRGEYVYLTDWIGTKFVVIDVSDPTNPSIAGSLTDAAYLDGPLGFDIAGQYAFVSSYNDSEFTVIDISDPTNPTIETSLTDATNLSLIYGVQIAGRYAYVACGSDRITAIDISDPTSPVVKDSYLSSTYVDNPSMGFKISGKYAYIPTLTDNMFTVLDLGGYDISTASIGSVATSQLSVINNATFGNNLYVASGLNVGAGGIQSNGDVAIQGSLFVLENVANSTAAASIYSEKLEVVSTGTTAATLYGKHISFTDATSTANVLYGLYVDATTANTSDTTYAAALMGGNVGIGTTAPGTLLQLGTPGTTAGTLGIAGVTSGLVTIDVAAATDSWNFTLPINDGDVNQVLQTDGSGNTSWVAQSAGTSYWTLNGTDLYPNSTSYDVGIGTTTPSTPLQVVRTQDAALNIEIVNSSAGTSSSAGFSAVGSGGGAFFSYASPSFTTVPAWADSGVVAADLNTAGLVLSAYASAGTIQFQTGGLPAANMRMIIDSAGKVGIGTSTPTKQLTVDSDSSALGQLALRDTRAYTQTPSSWLLFDGKYDVSNNYTTFSQIGGAKENATSGDSSGNMRFYINNGSTMVERFTIKSTGNIGIGNSNPGTLLHLGTAGTTAGALSLAGSSSGNVTLDVAAAAGTWNFTLPINDGDANQVLQTDGNGNTSWVAQSGGSSLWTDYTTYIATTSGRDVFPYANDTYDLGNDTNRWRNIYLGGETIHLGASVTDEATIQYTSSNILSFNTYTTTNGDIAFFTDDLYIDKSAQSLGINNTAPDASMDIQAYSGQTADLLNLANSSGNNLQVTDIRGALTQYIQAGGITLDGSITNTALNGAWRVDIVGNYAYVASFEADSLTIVDISEPSTPTLVGTISNSQLNGARGVMVEGKYAYVTAGEADRLTIVDISNPADPTIVGSVYDTNDLNGPREIFVSGNYAYIGAFDSGGPLTIVDISNPTNPTVVGHIDLGSSPYGVYIKDNYAYVTISQSHTLKIIDVSDPANPTEVTSYTDATNMNFPIGVYVSGKYAYVAANASDSFVILDVSNLSTGPPVAPTLVGNITGDSTNLNLARFVQVSGRYAYVTNDDHLTAIDISDPTNPTVAATYQSTGMSQAEGLRIDGNHAYVASFLDDALVVLDLGGYDLTTANIGNTKLGSLNVTDNAIIGNNLKVGTALNVGGGGIKTDGNLSLFDTLFAGSSILNLTNTDSDVNVGINQDAPTASLDIKAYTGQTDSLLKLKDSSDNILQDIDIRGALTQYIRTGSVEREGYVNSSTYFNEAWDVEVAGRYAYIIGRLSNSFMVMDITNPSSPSVVNTGTYALSGLTGPRGVRVAGDYAYVVGSGYLKTIDLSDRKNPTVVGTETTDLSGAYTVDISGQYAYVGCADSGDKFVVVDISNPTNPTTVSAITDATATQDIALVRVKGDYAYATTMNNDQFNVFDISDPTNPTVEYTYSTGLHFPYGFYISGRYAYVASRVNHSLVILDISDPGNISQAGIVTDSINLTSPRFVSVAGRYAYVTSGNQGVTTVDISDPANPVVVDSYQDSTYLNLPMDIEVSGKYAYVADYGGDNFTVLDLGGLDVTTANIGNIDTGNISVADRAYIGSSLIVGTSVNVGEGGIKTDGNLSIADTLFAGGTILNLTNVDSQVKVGINNTAPTASLDIKAYTGQTDSLLKLKDSSDNILQDIDIRGALTQYIETGTIEYKSSVVDATNLDGPYDIDTQGKYAYVVAYDTHRITALDISNPSSPVVEGSLADATNFNNPVQVKVRGKYAYVLSRTGTRITIVDISNPNSMSVVGTVNDATHFANARVLEVIGQYAYIGTMNSWFTVADISDPSNPKVVGYVQDTTNLNNLQGDVVVRGNYAYVTAWLGNRLTVLDISDPTSPTVAGSLNHTDINGALGVDIVGKYAFVASYYANRLVVVDISNPASPSYVTSIQDNTNLLNARYPMIAGRYIYVLASDRVTAVDISDPASPVVKDSYASTSYVGSPSDLYISGKYAYVTSLANNRFTVLDIGGYDLPTISSGSIDTGNLAITSNVNIGNNLNVGTALNVGQGGIMSNGNIVSGSSIALQDQLKIRESGASPQYNTIFQGGDQSGDITYTLPTSGGTSGYVLQTSGGATPTLSWVAQSAGTSYWTLNGTDLYPNSTSYNVGIGTNTPTSKLHTVASGAKTTDYIGNLLTNTATSSTASITKTGLSVTSTGTWDGTSAVNRGLYVTATGGTVNYAAIFDSGNVGIGTTVPASTLHVKGNLRVYDSGNTDYIDISHDGTNALFEFGSANALVVNNHILPLADDTYDLGATDKRWKDLYIGDTSIHMGKDNTDEAIMKYDSDNNELEITNATTDLKVGIGTTSPTEALTVSGGINVGNSSNTNAGTIRYTGSDIEGYVNSAWKSLTTQNTDVKQLVREFTAASGETISAGDVVSFINGEVKEGNNRFGSESPFNSASTAWVSAAMLDATHFVVAYQDQGNSFYGTAIVGTVSGNSISWGGEHVFSYAATNYISVAALSSSKIAVVFYDGSNANSKIGDISGSVISYGSYYQVESGTNNYLSVDALSSSAIVVGFHKNGGNAKVGTVSGTNISYGSKYTFNAATTAYISVSALSSTSFITAYQDIGNSSYGTAIGATVSGTAITYGTETIFNPGTTSYVSIDNLSSKQAVIAYADGSNSNYGTAVIADFALSTPQDLSFGQEYVYSPGGETYHNSVSALSSSEFVVAYQGYGTKYGTLVIGKASGNVISYGPETTFASASTAYTSVVALDSSKYAVSYQDTGNSSYGTSIIGDIYPIIGTAKSAISGGSSGLVVLSGVSDGHSGLAVGTTYYSNADGSLTTTANANLVGLALSTSEILLQGTAVAGGGGGGGGTGTSYWAESGSNIYNINAGNIGIGTSSPSSFKLQVTGNVGPSTDDTYTLGSTSLRWADLYLGAGSLHIGTSATDEAIVSYDTANNTLEFKPYANAASSFEFQNSSGSPIISIDTTNAKLGILEGGTSPTYYSYLKGGDQSANITYTLPADDGSDGQVLKTDGTGILSWVDPNSAGGPSSSFKAYKTSDQLIASGSWIKQTWEAEDFDTNSDFDLADDRFEPKVDGKYILTAAAMVQGLSDTESGQVAIFKNNVEIARGSSNSMGATSDAYSQVSIVVDAVAGDWYDVRVIHTHSAASRYVGSPKSYTYFSGSSLAGGGTSGVVPAFSVHKNNSSQTLTSGSTSIVTWSTEDFDTNNNFDLGTEKFTPTVPGKYMLSAKANTGVFTAAEGGQYICAIYKNNSIIKQGNIIVPPSDAWNYFDSQVTVVADANGVDDDFDFRCSQTSGTNKTISGGSAQTYFTGSRIDGGSGWWTKTSDYLYYNSTNVGIGVSDPSNLLDLQQAGTVKTNTNMLEITNSGNASDMDGTATGLLFNQYYYNVSAPAPVNSAQISAVTLNDWTSTASTQDSYLSVKVAINGSLSEALQVRMDQWTTALWTRALIVNGAAEWGYGSGFRYGIGKDINGYFQLGFVTQVDDTSAGYIRAITVDGAGSVGIGRYNTAQKFEVEGNASKSTAGDWLANSDSRIKTDIQSIDDAASLIMGLNPVKFKYSDWYLAEHPSIKNQYYYNFIAQEFAEAFPDSVQGSGEYLPDGSEILQLDPYNASVVAIAAIQEQQLMIVPMKSKIESFDLLIGADGSIADTLQMHSDNLSFLNDQMLQYMDKLIVLDNGIMVNELKVKEKAVFEGELVVKSQVAFNADTVGQAKILTGEKFVHVAFEKEYEYQPIVTITPVGINDMKYGVENITTHGFDIVIDPNQDKDVVFNWHAFGSDQGKLSVSDNSKEDINIVNHGEAVSISISPTSLSKQSGESVPYMVTAHDEEGESWDITSFANTSYEITDSGDGGSWLYNVYTTKNTGTWHVRASYKGLTSETTIFVY